MASITYLTTPQYLNEGFAATDTDLGATLTGADKLKFDNAFEACTFFLTNIAEQLEKHNVSEAELTTIMNELINSLPQNMLALDDDTLIKKFIQRNDYFRNDSILADNAVQYFNAFKMLIYTYLRIIDPPVNEQEFRNAEKSLQTLTKKYKTDLASNLKKYTAGNASNAANAGTAANQNVLRKDEDVITTLIAQLHATSMKMYVKGGNFQQQIMANNPAFNASLDLAEPVRAKFGAEELKLNSAVGEYESANRQHKAYRVRDYFYGVLAFIAVITVIYSLSNDDPNKAEYIILAMAVLVFVAQVYRKMAEFLADKTSQGLTNLGSVIGKAFYS